MRYIRVLCIVLCFILCATGCGKIGNSSEEKYCSAEAKEWLIMKSEKESMETEKPEETEQPEVTSTPSEQPTEVINSSGAVPTQTLMIYMVGSDLESEEGLATLDLQEIENSGFNQDTMNIILMAGGTKKWKNDEISSDTIGIYQIKNKACTKLKDTNATNMGESDTLTQLINYGYENFESDQYSLILWDHGSGAILGYGMDEKNNYDTLLLPELQKALEDSKIYTSKRLEWIGFDACLMASLELGKVVKRFAKYMIASEEIELGMGWDYNCLKEISNMQNAKGDKIGKVIIDQYTKFYKEKLPEGTEYTMSCVKLGRVDNVGICLGDWTDEVKKMILDGKYNEIAVARSSTKEFGLSEKGSLFDMIDLKDLINKLDSVSQEEKQKVLEALDWYVVYSSSNIPESSGVSIYFPYGNKESAKQWVDFYESIAPTSNYGNLVQLFNETLQGKPLFSWTIMKKEFENIPNTSDYSLQLTQEEGDSICDLGYSLWEESKEEPGYYIQWLNSKDISLDQENRLTLHYESRRFYLKDDNGTYLCSADAIEKTNDYVKYAIPVEIDMADGNFAFAYVSVLVDKQNPEGKIVGIYKQMDADKPAGSKSMITLQQGDKIICTCKIGTIMEEEWGLKLKEASNFSLKGELGVSFKEPEEKKATVVMGYVTDTQGNDMYAKPFTISQ